MNELHLFAGAGGGILGSQLLGHTCVCAVEIEPYPRSVLLARQRDGILPKFPIWDDVTTFNGYDWRGKVDVVCGGFPCQDISVAGNGEGITGSRSGLWTEFARIIREVQSTYVFVENSSMLISRGLDVVLGDLAEMGYDARWGVFGAADVGSCHSRKRTWILATHSDSKRVESVDLQELQIINTQKSRRRQFTRAIDAALSEDDYAEMRRDTDALASGMDRLKAIGNGQDAMCAAYAWNRLIKQT